MMNPQQGEEEDGTRVDDPLVVHKCLEMIFQLLQDRAVEMNPTLRTLFDELVLPAIQNLQAPIRKSAVAAMGVCLLRNIELASHHLPLLFQIAHLDEVSGRIPIHFIGSFNLKVMLLDCLIDKLPKALPRPYSWLGFDVLSLN